MTIFSLVVGGREMRHLENNVLTGLDKSEDHPLALKTGLIRLSLLKFWLTDRP